MSDLDYLTEFTITEDHLKLSRRMNVDYNAYTEFGAPCIDPKRPYGNSSVIRDLIEILHPNVECDEDGDFDDFLEARVCALHKEMQLVLQIWLCTGQIRIGTFVRENQYSYDAWKLKDE